MEIVFLTEDEVNSILPLIPESALQGICHVIAAKDQQGMIKGFEVVRELDTDHVAVTFLYVMENARNQGIGSALIRFVADSVNEEAGRVMTIQYPLELEDAPVLNYMLSSINCEIENEIMYSGSISREQAFESRLFGIAVNDESKADIYPLEEIPEDVLDEYMSRDDFENGYELDVFHANQILSLGLGIEGHMQGILLVSDGDKPGDFDITFFHVAQDHSAHVLSFLRQAFSYLFEADDLVQKVSFSIYDERIKRLVDLLVQDISWEEDMIVNGALISAAQE